VSQELRILLKTHINKQEAINNEKIRKTMISDRDREAAREIALKVVKKKYGRKVPDATMTQWVEEDLQMMGQTQPPATHMNTDTPVAVPSKKRQRDSPGTTENTAKKPLTTTTTTSTEPQTTTTTRTSTATPTEPHTTITPTATPAEPPPTATPAEPPHTPTTPTPVEPHTSTTSPTPAEPPHTSSTPTPVEPHTSTTSPTVPVSADDDDDDDLADTSLCSRIRIEPQPTTPASTSSNTDHLRRFIYDSKKKNAWELKIHKQPTTLILGDSNMRLARNIPDDWEIHAYPGAYLKHAANLLQPNKQPNKLPDSIKNIVVAVGVNNRSWVYARSTKPDLTRVGTRAKALGGRVHFLGISTSGLSSDEDANIKQLNTDARSSFGRNFIHPLPTEQVIIAPSDPIHHDQSTVDRIIDSIKCHLN
jgi:hypothetical protein